MPLRTLVSNYIYCCSHYLIREFILKTQFLKLILDNPITLFCVFPELPQQCSCKEEEVLTDWQLGDQERKSSLHREDPEPPQIKEEQVEVCIKQEEEEFVPKQETDVVTHRYDENGHSEGILTSIIRTVVLVSNVPSSSFTTDLM